jgi:hypothetical protein
MIYVEQEQEKPGILKMDEQETTNDLFDCRSKRNQGFCRWRSRKQPLISVDAGAGETRGSVDGGAGDNQ